MNYYLIGHDIQKSLSPQIHNIIYGELGVKAQYSLIDTADLSFGLRAAKDADGFNITTPFKQEILRHVVDAAGIGSVNTVMGGKGYSTDGEGFLLDAKRLGLDLSEVLVLGAGGAARAVCHALKNINSRIYLFSRSGNSLPFAQSVLPPFDAKLIVNCTGRDYDSSLFKGQCYDLRYNNFQGIGSVGMLIYQAILSDEIFFGRKIDLDIFNIIYKQMSSKNLG